MTGHSNLNCDDYQQMLSARLDGELEEEEWATISEHMTVCSYCSRRLEELAAVDNQVAWDVGLSEDFRGRITDAGTIRQTERRPLGLRVVLAVAAGLLLALALPSFRAAPEIQADDFIQPLVNLERIEQQENLTRRAMYRAVELDLRALKLELQEARLDEETQRDLLARLDQLTFKFRGFDEGVVHPEIEK